MQSNEQLYSRKRKSRHNSNDAPPAKVPRTHDSNRRPASRTNIKSEPQRDYELPKPIKTESRSSQYTRNPTREEITQNYQNQQIKVSPNSKIQQRTSNIPNQQIKQSPLHTNDNRNRTKPIQKSRFPPNQRILEEQTKNPNFIEDVKRRNQDQINKEIKRDRDPRLNRNIHVTNTTIHEKINQPQQQTPPSSSISIQINQPQSQPQTINLVSNSNPINNNRVKFESLISNPNSLPIVQHKKEILNLIRSNQVVIISGDTGSGKSTQVPKYILEDCETFKRKCNIVCSQPRRIAATSLARRVSEELQSELGETVGYQISMDKKDSVSTKILFCTTGILVERLVHQGSTVKNYTHIIIDEVHERSLEIDLTLILLKKLLPINPNVRLILMSATIDCDLFASYFILQKSHRNEYYNSCEHMHLHAVGYNFNNDNSSYHDLYAPVKKISGFCYPINLYYIDDVYQQLAISQQQQQLCDSELDNRRAIITNLLYDICVDLVTNIDTQNPNNSESESILIFLPGIGEIRKLYELFSKKGLFLYSIIFIIENIIFINTGLTCKFLHFHFLNCKKPFNAF